LTDENGLLVKLAITPGEANDITVAADLLADIGEGQILLGDKAYDADWLRPMLARQGVPGRTFPPAPIARNRSLSAPAFIGRAMSSSVSSIRSNGSGALQRAMKSSAHIS